jgi:hypothetical protein
MNKDRSVQPLQRIRLAMKAGSTAADMDIHMTSEEAAFIFGIGPGGMTPFECLLNQRAENETIAFGVAASEAELFFGHLFLGLLGPALGRLFEGRNKVYFNVRITAIETPQPREIIKAMADMTAHGHGAGCDCGCGCG